ncbi:MAG: hypothetical protein H7Y04_12450 [Verrucomicrobia bacterium]|nr:hypothetical protein [Cytophagales bacterium]
MALPKKGLRKITVNNIRYGWSATGQDGGIGLSIIPLHHESQILIATFGYHSKEKAYQMKDGSIAFSDKQQFIITPFIVRQVIEYGLNSGWNPEKGKSIINLGSMDDKIDLNLKK